MFISIYCVVLATNPNVRVTMPDAAKTEPNTGNPTFKIGIV